jgi:hypothetical protein
LANPPAPDPVAAALAQLSQLALGGTTTTNVVVGTQTSIDPHQADPMAASTPAGFKYATQAIDLGPESMQPLGMSGAAIYQLQQQMFQAGLLSEADLKSEAGTWGEKSRVGYTELLKEAYGAGRWTKAADGTYSADALGQLQQNIKNYKGTPGGTTTLLKLTSPETIADIAQQVAVKKEGRTLNPDELSSIVSHFQAAERASQTAEQQAQQSGGGSYTIPPTPDSSTIGAEIAQTSPGEVGAQSMGQALQSFSAILGRHFGFTGVGIGSTGVNSGLPGTVPGLTG